MTTKIFAIMSAVSLGFSVLLPVSAVASSQTGGVLINEVMAASLESNKDEFIELVNSGNSDVDLAGWTIEYVNGSGVSTVIYTFATNSMLTKDGYFLGVLSQTPASLFLNNLSPKFEYSLAGQYGMAVSSGGIVLKNNNNTVIDNVYWTDNATSTDLKVVPGMVKAKSIERKVTDGIIINTGEPGTDFIINNLPTPTAENDISVIIPPQDPIVPTEPTDPVDPAVSGDITQESPADSNDEADQASSNLPEGTISDSTINESQSTVMPDTTPTSQIPSYISLVINELFIDPESPLTDANDEFVEIYNPNTFNVNLSGYTIVAGNTGNYRHTFGPNDVIAPQGYLAITSKDTALALSNSGGKVLLNDSSGNTLSSVSYDEAKPGEAWALDANGQWLWTTTVTAGGINIITVALPPPAKATAAAIGASTKKATSSISKAKTTTTTPKAASTKVAKATAVKAAADTKDYSKIVDAPVFVPVWLLALIGGLAVIYLGYEYRFEISNKIYQLRQYRANR